MKANRTGFGSRVLCAVLAVVTIIAWARESFSSQAVDLAVNVGESVRVEVAEAKTLAVADPSIADAQIPSTKEFLVIGKRPGVTTLTVYDQEGAPRTYRVVVNEGEYPSKTIKDAINLPSVQVRVVGNSVILEGTVATDREMERAVTVAGAYREKVVNLLEVSNPAQVRIRMKVADVRLASVKNKGLEYPDSIVFSMDMVGENVLNGNGASILGGGKAFASILFGSSSTSGGSLQAPDERDAGVWAKLNILERNGDLRTLAEPTLVTLSGKEASFLAGGEFPVVIALQNSFSVEFKEFGVRMKIKPVVDSKENIQTEIQAELSQIDPTLQVSSSTIAGGVNIPGLVSRKASTSVQLQSGQTIMIGGLLDRTTTEALRRVPWIGKVPVLGLLFTSTTKDSVDRELIFFATLDLVRNPTEEAQAAPVSSGMKEILSEPKLPGGKK